MISLTDDELLQMPAELRRQLLDFVASRLAVPRVAQDGDAAASSYFSFSSAPPGSRHPDRKLVSFSRQQARDFMRFFDREDTDSWATLAYLIRENLEAGVNSKALADYLDLNDARMVSPFLKKTTHAVRRFTGDSKAAWYTLDSKGNFLFDPRTLSSLRDAAEVWNKEWSQSSEKEEGEWDR